MRLANRNCGTQRGRGTVPLGRFDRLGAAVDQLQREDAPVTDLYLTQLDQLVDPLRGHETPRSKRIKPEDDALNHARTLTRAVVARSGGRSALGEGRRAADTVLPSSPQATSPRAAWRPRPAWSGAPRSAG